MRLGCVVPAVAVAAVLGGCPDWDSFSRGSPADAGPSPSLEAGVDASAAGDGGVDAEAFTDAALEPAIAIDSVLEPSGTIDLTALGATDWIELHDKTGAGNRCRSCTAAIAPLATNGAALDSFADDPRTFVWSNGQPLSKGTSTGGVLVVEKGSAFQFTVTPNGTRQVFTIHVNTFDTGASISARFEGLSMTPTPTFDLPAILDAKQYAVRVHFRGPSGAKLRVDYTETSIVDGADPTDFPNIAFGAATLAQEP